MQSHPLDRNLYCDRQLVLTTHTLYTSSTDSVLSLPPEWLPALNKVGRKAVDHDITEPLAPVLIKRLGDTNVILKTHL